jgi:hypothetical protein
MSDVFMIGLKQCEIQWVRLLVDLLRSGDPLVVELSREALRYLEGVAARNGENRAAV